MSPLNSILLFVSASLFISITAVVYSYVLVQPGEIFSWLYRKLDVLFQNDKRSCTGKSLHPVFKMIIGCSKCVAGQMSLWIFLTCAWPWYLKGYFILIIVHILFIGLTVFLTLSVSKFYKTYIE